MAQEWLDVAEEIQRQVVFEFGLEAEYGLALLRSATHRFPDLSHLAVYVRNNRARDGQLQAGDLCENVPLLDFAGAFEAIPDVVEPSTSLHAVAAKSPLTVLCAGSFT